MIVLTFGSAFGETKESKSKIVVIDAGHGGKDPGTIVGIAREKNIVLDIALKLGRLIKEQSPNIKVVYTRDGDYFIPLMDRPQIANKINADLFISIHANYCGSPEINGTETYVLGLHRTEDNLNVAKKENSVILLEDDYTTRYEGFNPNLSESYIMFELMQDNYLEQSLSFASILQSNFRNQARRRDREVRQAGFLVLRESSMPSVLIETGYLSNKKENAYLLTDAGRAEIAQSIYGSLINYLSKTEAKNNRTVKPVEPTNTEKVILKGKAIKKKPSFNPEFEAPSHTVTPAPAEQIKKEDTIRQSNVGNPSKESQSTVSEKTADKPSKHPKTIERPTSESKAKTDESSMVVYAIQIGVFSRKLKEGSAAFKGISPIRELVSNGHYKYFCFESGSFQTTKENFKKIAGIFPDAFIVSIDGEKVKMVWENKRSKK